MHPQLTFLGQSGVLLRFGTSTVVIDPYLTDSVAERYGEVHRRLYPPVQEPHELKPVDWILLTHAHGDHTDLPTLLPLAEANPNAQIIAPWESRELLAAAGFPKRRLHQPPQSWFSLGDDVQVKVVPAAHLTIETNPSGEWRYVGYLIRHGGQMLYHSGDTIPDAQIFASVTQEGSPDWALLPVNERNYFKAEQDLVGNMTVREAFQFADAVGARSVIPLHWDLFRLNSVDPAEIELIHRLEPRRFELHLLRSGQSLPVLRPAAD
jgi:L-ascorbate 6-phosphate lactonase